MFLHEKILKKGFILKGGFWFLILHDREAVMLYSPTGVGKTWLSLTISLIKAGKGSLELLDWQNEDPQSVCYVDGDVGRSYPEKDQR